MSEFQVGDKVRLKEGGPVMTVVEWPGRDKPANITYCRWWAHAQSTRGVDGRFSWPGWNDYGFRTDRLQPCTLDEIDADKVAAFVRVERVKPSDVMVMTVPACPDQEEQQIALAEHIHENTGCFVVLLHEGQTLESLGKDDLRRLRDRLLPEWVIAGREETKEILRGSLEASLQSIADEVTGSLGLPAEVAPKVTLRGICSSGCCFECESCCMMPRVGTPLLCDSCISKRDACNSAVRLASIKNDVHVHWEPMPPGAIRESVNALIDKHKAEANGDICRCDISKGGCTCGVMERERAAKEGV